MIIQNAILHTEDRLNASYGFFALKIHYLIKNLAGLMMMFALLPSLIRFLRIRKNDKNKQLFNRWLLILWVLFTLNSFVWVAWSLTINDLIPVVLSQNASQLLVLFFSMVVLLMGIAPLYFPTILYGFPNYSKSQEPLPTLKASKTKQHSITELETEHRFGFVEQEMVKKLKDIEKQQLFLSHDFDIAALANRMGLPVHHLSYFLNQYYETNYSEPEIFTGKVSVFQQNRFSKQEQALQFPKIGLSISLSKILNGDINVSNKFEFEAKKNKTTKEWIEFLKTV
jgi:hypothetical protein